MLPLKDNVPTRSFPLVTIGLIAANAVVWIWELTGTSWQQDVIRDGFYPCTLHGPCVGVALHHQLPWYESSFLSMFMHAGWLHILGNMLFLWIFGNNIEDALGRVRFFFWYIAAGIAATALQTFVTLNFGSAASASVPNVGASGAIAGVLGAYFVLLPTASVLTIVFFFPVELPAVVFLGFWFFYQWLLGNLSLLAPQSGGGVAFFAHIGGFLFGVMTARLVAKRRPLMPVYDTVYGMMIPRPRRWQEL
jgi:membrane associated rhomboid family serine protease